jgi:hypothetical protein
MMTQTKPQIPEIVLIIANKRPPATTYRFLPQKPPDLDAQLKQLGLSEPSDYLALYDKDKLCEQNIELFWENKRQCVKARPEEPGFPDLAHPDTAINRLVQPLKEKEKFKYRDDETHEAKLKHVPHAIVALKARVETLLHTLEDKNSDNKDKTEERDKVIKPDDASAYISGELKNGMKTVASEALHSGIFYHQPHHDLTPGILWLDEIFKVLASRVGGIVSDINCATRQGRKLDLTPLEEFIGQVGDQDKGNEFTKLIYPGGEIPPGLNEMVDPTRVELRIEGSQIVCAALIVGAWKGGTHSAGHT